MTKKHTSVEVKLEAARQILDGKKSVREMAVSLNLHSDTVNRWVIAYKKRGQNGLKNPYTHESPQSKNGSQKVRELEKKTTRKEIGEWDIKKVPVLSQGERISKKFNAISYLRKDYSVRLLCTVLGVSTSGY